jgi:S1-C subfamily serine protease
VTLGDVIVSIDGVAVKNSEDLRAGLDVRQAGDAIELGILRNDRRIEVMVTLAAGQ